MADKVFTRLRLIAKATAVTGAKGIMQADREGRSGPIPILLSYRAVLPAQRLDLQPAVGSRT
jgi:hypothetical protein